MENKNLALKIKNMNSDELNQYQILLQTKNGMTQFEAIEFINSHKNMSLKRFPVFFDGKCCGEHESCKSDNHHVDTCPAAIEY